MEPAKQLLLFAIRMNGHNVRAALQETPLLHYLVETNYYLVFLFHGLQKAKELCCRLTHLLWAFVRVTHEYKLFHDHRISS